MMRLSCVAALLSAAAGLGCGNFTNFTTARSMEEGEGSFDWVIAQAGASYALDLRARMGFGGGLEGGVSVGWSGLVNADLKLQFINQTDEPANRKHPRRPGQAPINMAIDVGVGEGLFTRHAYAGLIASRSFEGRFEPYIAYRYQAIELDLDFGDPDDIEDTEDTPLEDAIEDATDDRIYVHHLFIGAEISLGNGMYLIPEYSVLGGDAKGTGDLGVAIGIRW